MTENTELRTAPSTSREPRTGQSPGSTQPPTSNEPLSFDAESSKQARLSSAAFRSRVPMVLVFVGKHGTEADTTICNLNRSLIRFGELRIQLLVVVDGYPSEVAERLGVTVPLVTDDGLADELNAHIDEQGRLAAVVVGNDGRVLSVVRQLPTDDQALAILVAVESLSTQFPDRFTVLPDGDENAERIEDATSAQTEFSAASLRQQLSWITGDRDREAKALADTLPDTGSPDAVLVAAKKAVADAHSDAPVSAHDPVTSDVANAADVITKLDADEPAHDGEPLDSPLDSPSIKI